MDDLQRQARALWARGTYERVAQRLAPAAEVLCEAAGVGPGTRVLDVGAGTGNVALAAVARGAQVVASDVAPAMLERGRARTAGQDVEWVEADARALPFADDAFDVVLSCFGAIFAPDPRRTAGELLRVAGVVALSAWTPGGPQAEAHRIVGAHLPPPPPGAPDPMAWGDATVAAGHLEAHGATAEVTTHELEWRFPDGAEGYLAHFERDAPPIVVVREHLGEDGWAPVRAELLETVLALGEQHEDGTFVARAPYLVVTARR